MSAVSKLFLFVGGINLALVVMLGAFGAHILKARIAGDMMAVYHTATLYHAIHALGLLAIGILAAWLPGSGYLKLAAWVMLAGIIVFCGSLYLLSVTETRWLGALAPVGGVAFIVAWVLFCIAVLKAASVPAA